MHYSRMANGFKIDLRLDSGKEVKYMDSCDSAGRKNKTDGFSECFGTGQMSVGV